MSSKPWLSVFAFITGLASIAGLTLGLFSILSSRGGDLEIRVTSQQAQLAGAFGGKIKIAVDDSLLDEASVVEALLINGSGRELRTDDFEVPISLSVTGGVIVDFDVIRREPHNLAIDMERVSPTTLRFSKGIFRMSS